MAARRGDERGGEDVGVGGEGGRVAERGGEMGRREGKARSDGEMESRVEREEQGQTKGLVQTETWGQTEELVVIGRSFYMPCRHTNCGTHTQ